MKAVLFISLAFCLLLAGAATRATRTAHGAAMRGGTARTVCPVITLTCPETLARPGLPLELKLKVVGAGPSASLAYRLTASAGQISSGADGVINGADAERAAVVDTTGLAGNSEVTATVEVSGLERSCATSASCTTAVLRPFDPHPLDSYGDISYEDEQARLDNFAVELQNLPRMNGYVVCYGGRRGRRGEALTRCERAKRYLVGRRGLAPERLVLIDGGYQERAGVWLWIMPPGVSPKPTPTVDPSEVEFTGGAKRRKPPAARVRRSRGRRSKLTQ